jgi:hypothetical protein
VTAGKIMKPTDDCVDPRARAWPGSIRPARLQRT